MSRENSASGKPTTRASIRHSLNLASMGKALVDVINKDGRDVEKVARKSKDSNARRLSAMNLMQGSATSRASLDSKTGRPSFDSKTGRSSLDSMNSALRVVTTDSRTITRQTRRSSGLPKPVITSSDESAAPVNPAHPLTVTRSASLRPKVNAASSSLPKYRPKSVALDSKPSSPPWTGTRRRLSSSEDEEEQRGNHKARMSQATLQSPAAKKARPISPLPQRGVLKASLSSAINIPPSTPPTRKITPSPKSSPPKSSLVRPTKSAKTTTVSSPTRTAIPRPLPTTPSTGSCRSPKTPTSTKSTPGLFRSGRDKTSPTPLRSPDHAPPELSLVRHSRKGSSCSPTRPTRAAASAKSSTSPILEEDSEEDVEILLAPDAPLGAPTPAMPRAKGFRNLSDNRPQTPMRSSSMRGKLSYLSPEPPSTELSRQLTSQSSGRPRRSLLSWEQLATEGSRTLGDDDIDKMLSDVPPPFRSGDISPRLSVANLEIPESPMLSAFNSPGGYGSISQVLLPDATPSPAVHGQQRYQSAPAEIPAVDAATVTLLRLQLAGAEHTSKERLLLVQSMEDEIRLLKEARTREGEELSKQVSFLEEQLHNDLAARERKDEEHAAYRVSLEEQLRHEHSLREIAVSDAIAKAYKTAEESLKAQQREWESTCSAHKVAATWASALEIAEGELDLVRANKEESSTSPSFTT